MKITIEVNSLEELFGLSKRLEDIVNCAEIAENELYAVSIDALMLTVRSDQGLKAAGITKIGSLIEKSESDILKLPNMGRKSLCEIRDMLASRGFPPLGSYKNVKWKIQP